MGALHELIRKELEIDTEAHEQTVAVPDYAVKILNNNPDRIMLMIMNIGGSSCYIGLTSEVKVGSGLLIDASGGAVIFNYKEDGELVGREFWAISELGTTLYIMEVEGR
jgi:hypothetical protein